MKTVFCFLLLVFSMYKNIYGDDKGYQNRLKEMKASFERINDYSCTFESFSSNGEKSQSVSFNYFFKKPANVRMEVLTGKYSGTILLYQGEEVKLKLTNIVLGLFTFSFLPDHRYVCDLRGNGLHNSDWGFFITEHFKMKDITESRFLGEEILDKRDVVVYELISKDPSRSRFVAKEHLWIDKEMNIIIKYMQYDVNGRLIQSGFYKHISLNKGLKQEVFTSFKD